MICDGLLMFCLDLFNSCIKPTWYDIFQDVLLTCFTLVFLRFYNDMHDPRDLSRPPTDVSICLRPKNFPTWDCLNQFCSSLSTSTSLSLRLNSLNLLLSLETLNTEDISIIISAPVRSFLICGQVPADIFVSTLGQHWDRILHLAFCSELSQQCIKSWCRALRAFYQTFLLPLCNVFCHVYENTLKSLEIDNISSVSKHESKSSNKFFHFHLQMDGC